MTQRSATAPFTPRPRRRGVGARVLGSKLLDALTYPHGVDRYAEIVRPVFSLVEPRAEVRRVHRPAAEMVCLTLRPNRNWEGFRAGQFAQIGVEIDGVWHTRSYSPSRSAHDPELIELTVRVHPHGLVSRYLRDHASPGMVVKLSEPRGEFFLPDRRPRRLTMVSGGSGITPVLSMLRTLRDEGAECAVTFLHYARGPEHVPYVEELEVIAEANANVRLAFAYTRERGGELGGHFSPAHLRQLDVEPDASDAFVCGPAALIEGVRSQWDAADAAERFHAESFVPPALSPADGEAVGTIRFASSGIEVENDGTTLLEQAEAAGLSPRHGCRMGICHTCRCRVAQGAVRDVRSGEVTQLVDSEAQICISVPVSDIELEI